MIAVRLGDWPWSVRVREKHDDLIVKVYYRRVRVLGMICDLDWFVFVARIVMGVAIIAVIVFTFWWWL